MVLKVIEGDWKRAAVTMGRVRGRIGEVLGWAQARGLRPPGPLILRAFAWIRIITPALTP